MSTPTYPSPLEVCDESIVIVVFRVGYVFTPEVPARLKCQWRHLLAVCALLRLVINRAAPAYSYTPHLVTLASMFAGSLPNLTTLGLCQMTWYVQDTHPNSLRFLSSYPFLIFLSLVRGKLQGAVTLMRLLLSLPNLWSLYCVHLNCYTNLALATSTLYVPHKQPATLLMDNENRIITDRMSQFGTSALHDRGLTSSLRREACMHQLQRLLDAYRLLLTQV